MLKDKIKKKTQLKKDSKKLKPTWLTRKNLWSWSWNNNNPIKIKYKNKFLINPTLKYKFEKKQSIIKRITKKIIRTSQLKNCKKKKRDKKTKPHQIIKE